MSSLTPRSKIKIKIFSLMCLLILNNFAYLPIGQAQEILLGENEYSLQLPVAEDIKVAEPIFEDLPIAVDPPQLEAPVDLPFISDDMETIVDDEQEKDFEPSDILQDKATEPPLYRQKDEIHSITKKLNINTDLSNGALIHSYIIEIPLGRNGLQPDLQLNYNNQDIASQNIFGYGWSINIPYIERVAREGVDKLYTTNYFNSSLTGELVLTEVSGVYASKVDSGEFFDYHYDSVNNLWIVKDKIGKIYTFGATSNSRQDNPNNTSRVYKWMLEEIRDTNDNFIRYEYFKNKGQIYPATIYYTGHSVTDGIFKVEFLRESRNDNVNNFEVGFLVNTDYRISQIDISINNQWTSRYNLNYITGENGSRSLLGSIARSGRDASGGIVTLPAEELIYQQKYPGWTLNANYNIPVAIVNGFERDRGARIADVNGDGLVDMLLSNYYYGEDHKAVFIRNSDGIGWTQDDNYIIPIFFSNGDGFSQGEHLVDVNGDAFTDLFISGAVHMNDGDNTGWTSNNNYLLPCRPINNDNKDNGCYIADVNGDGLIDILYAPSTGDNAGVYINNGDNTGWTRDINYSIPVSFVDIWTQDRGIHIADVNGDGLDDIVMSNSNPYPEGNKHVYINDGDGTGWTEDTNYALPIYFASGNGSDFGVRLVDVNGDGLSDLLQANSDQRGIYLNDGDGTGWTLDSNYLVPCIFVRFDVFGNKDPGCRIADVNGDGLVDLLNSPLSGVGTGIYLSNPNKADLLSEIKYSTGAIAHINYKSSAEYVGSNNDRLNLDLPLTVQTVEQLSIDNGLDNQVVINYQYSYGRFYYNTPRDRKFAGFGKIEKIETDKKITTYYHQANGVDTVNGEQSDSYAQIGKPYKIETRDSNNNLKSVENLKWETIDQTNGRQLVLNTQKITTDLSTPNIISTAIQYNYDINNGNILSENNLGKVVADYNMGTVSTNIIGDEKTTEYQYAQNSIKHILAVPKNKSISNTVEDKEQDLYYDNLPFGLVDKVNLTKEDYIDQDVEINRNFDVYGLAYKEISPKGTTTTLAYDNDHLYPTSYTNALNQTTYTSYNLLNGQIDSSIASNGLKTANLYDAFGRLNKVQSSDVADPNNLVTQQEVYYYDKSTLHYPSREMEVDFDTIALWHTNGMVGSADKKDNAEGSSAYDLTEHFPFSTVDGFDGVGQGAYSFVRTNNNYLSVPDSTELDLNNNFTIEAWINFASLPAADEFRTIVNKNDGGNNKQYAIGYRNDASGLGYSGVYVFISSNGTKSVINNSALWRWEPNINQWYYLAITYDKLDGKLEVFINGNSLGIVSGFPTQVFDGDNNFNIGAINGSAAWDGGIDEIRISAKARADQEIYNYYNNPNKALSVEDYRYKETKNYFTDSQYTTSREYYDGLDRVIEVKNQLASGQYATVYKLYDDHGRIVKESLPYNTVSLDYTNPDLSKPAKTYTYDVLDRVLTETTPVGNTSYEYDGLTTKITDANGHIKELTKDAYGNLVQVKEHNGANIYTTSYEYTLTNKLKKIIDSAGNIRNFSYDALDNLEWQDMVHKTSVTNPAKIQYTYDKNGNVITETSFKNDAISYTYDNLNRPLTEQLSGVTKLSYTYDQNGDTGQLTLADYGNGNAKAYDYDVLGRVTIATTTIANENFVLKYEYNNAGALKKVIYPNNYEVEYTFNNVGQVSGVTLTTATSTQNLVSNIEYNQNGQMTHIERANGVITDYTYDPAQAFRLTRILSVKATTTLQDLNYTYDAVGNILTLIDNANTDLQKQASYTYDDVNRLLTATVIYTNHPDKNYTQTFTYDSIGNMTSNSDLGTLSYANGQPHQLSSYGTRNFQYDAAGNMTRNGGISKFMWDWRNRLSSSTDIASNKNTYYQYDHNNQRFIKWTEEYIFIPPDPGEEVPTSLPNGDFSVSTSAFNLELDGAMGGHWEWQGIAQDKYIDKYFEKDIASNTKSHIYLNDIKLATVNNNNNPYYLLTDHLSSSSILTDSTGTTDQLSDYKPFGTINYDNQLVDLKDDYTFTGKELDEENSLQYYGARYNDNQLGRFVSIDPVLIKVDSIQKILADPQSLNSYAYSRNNPIILVDRDGNFWEEVGSFTHGLTNAVYSNNVFGYGRVNSDNYYFSLGQRYGDSASLIQGGLETAAGVLAATGGVVGGIVTSPTGVGTMAGAGVAAGGVAVAGHGAGVTGIALRNMTSGSGKSASSKAASGNYVDNIDDIILPSRQNHILNGDATGGGHKFSAGKGKPEFPSSWSGKQIFHNAADIATDPSLNWSQQRDGRWFVSGIRDNVNMKVIIDPTKSYIINAFPKIK